MKTALFALLLLLCAPAFAATEAEQASYFNIALAPSLLGAANACGAPSRLPTEDDIFSVADARIVSVIPQIGNATSDLSNASVAWSWSADFPQEARFSIRDDVRCPAGEIRYSMPSSPALSGALSYEYGNSTETLALSSAGANPLPLDLGAEKLTGADFMQLFAPLSISLSAAISVSFSFAKSGYSYRCSGEDGYSGCGCERNYEYGSRTFWKNVSDARNFSVETGPNSIFWLNPPLSSRLSGNESGKLALFARRLPASISLFFRGKEIAAAKPYSFSVKAGECGEKAVERQFSPPSRKSAIVSISTGEPIFPSQLVDKDASYAPFYMEFPWNAEDGKANFTIILVDAFSHRQEFLREFAVREPVPFSLPPGAAGGGGAMEKREASGAATAAAYPARAQQAAFPDFSVISAAFAFPLAIGAAALARRLEWRE